jgi:hypothetical protein
LMLSTIALGQAFPMGRVMRNSFSILLAVGVIGCYYRPAGTLACRSKPDKGSLRNVSRRCMMLFVAVILTIGGIVANLLAMSHMNEID